MVDFSPAIPTKKRSLSSNVGRFGEDMSSYFDNPSIPKNLPKKGTGWGFIDFGQQMFQAGVDIFSRFPELAGTLGSWIDRDTDENDWLSTGSRWLDDAGDVMRKWSEEVAPVDYEITDFDTALTAWNEDKSIVPMLKFMRDTAPTALTYLGAAMIGHGIPLGLSEFQRILDDRMKNKGLTTADARPEDVGASAAGAAVNVFLERLPWMQASRPGKKFSYWKFLGMENATEFGQGSFEDIVTTAGTEKGWDYKNSFKEGLAEMIGGFGVVAGSAPLASRISRKVNEDLARAEEEKVDPTPTIPWTSGSGTLPVLEGELDPRGTTRPSTVTLDGVEVPITEPLTIPVDATPGERVDAGTYNIDVPTPPIETVDVTATVPDSDFEITIPRTIPRIRPIERPIPTNEPDVDLYITYGDDKLSEAASANMEDALSDAYGMKRGAREISRKERRELSRKRLQEIKRQEGELRKAEVAELKRKKEQAEESAHLFIQTQIDEGIDLEVALDTAEEHVRLARENPDLGNQYANDFLKTYNQRWKSEYTKRKRRAPTVVATEVDDQPKVKDDSPVVTEPKEDWRVPIVRDDGLTLSISEEGGKFNLVATDKDGNILEETEYKRADNAQRAARSITTATIQEKIDKANQKEAARIKAEKRKLKKEQDNQDEKNKQDELARRAAEADAIMRANKEKEDQAKADEDQAKADAEANQLADEEDQTADQQTQEMIDKEQATVDRDLAEESVDEDAPEATGEPTIETDDRSVTDIVKDIDYEDRYDTLSEEGKKEVQQLLGKSTVIGEELNDVISEEIDQIISFEAEEKAGDTETDVTATDIEMSDEFKTDEELKKGRVLERKKEGKDRTLVKKKRVAEPGSRRDKFPVEVDLVLGLTHEVFTEKVDNTEGGGGYRLDEIRTIAKNALIPSKGWDRNALVERLKWWYGDRNNSDETLSNEDTDGIILEDTFDDDYQYTSIIRSGRESDSAYDSNQQVKSAILSQLRSIFGREAARNMQELKFININTSSELNKGRKKPLNKDDIAYYSRMNGKVYFVLDHMVNARLTSDDVRGTILHEISVHAGKELLSKKEWTNIRKTLFDLYVAGDIKVVKAFNTASESLGQPGVRELVKREKRVLTKTGRARIVEEHSDFDDLFNEALAYYATQNPRNIKVPGDNVGIMATIRQGIVRFFTALARKYDPSYNNVVNITNNDISFLVSHLTMRVRESVLSRYGDNIRSEKKRIKARDNFVEGSVEKGIVYHGTTDDYSLPLIVLTELGMHFGTEQAALDRVMGNKDKVRSYYINIKNPLIVNEDLLAWDSIKKWKSYTDRTNFAEDSWVRFIEVYDLAYDDLSSYRFSQNLETLKAEFTSKFREHWLSKGYDGIRYLNKNEGVIEGEPSISYIIFKDEQASRTNIYEYSPRKNQPSSEDIQGNELYAKKAFPTERISEIVSDTYKGSGKFRATWESIRNFFEPMVNITAYRELMMRRYEARGETTIGENSAKNVYDIFAQATESEKVAIFKYMTTRGADPSSIPNRKVSFATRETIFKGRKPGGRLTETVGLRDKAVEIKQQLRDLGQELVNLGLLPKEKFSKLEEAYLPKVYLRYLLGDEYKGLGSGMKTSRMDYVKARRLHSQWVADVLYGEIKDPGFLASRYISQVTKDIAIIKYLNWIVTNSKGRGWVLPKGTTSFKEMKSVSIYWLESESEYLTKASELESISDERRKEMLDLAREMRDAARKVSPAISAYDSKKYKQIPNQPRYGIMRGVYVRKEIYDDMMGIAGAHGEQSAVARFFTPAGLGGKTQQVFKYTRVIANPPTLSRNIVSNMVLLHTSGVSMFRIPSLLGRSMNELVNDGKYYKIAQKYGVEVGTFTSEEIRRIDMEFLAHKKEPTLFEKFTIVLGKAAGPGSRFYQKSEVLFKVAKIIDGIENKGLSEAEASLEAQESILDYSLVSPSVRFLRSVPFGAPFITFQVKVLPQLLKNLRKHPLSFAPYVALPYIMATLFAAENDVDDEDLDMLKKHMGEWARDRGSIYFFPGRGEDGRWRAIDVGYFFPWTAWFEASKDMMKGEFGDAWQDTGLFSGPVDVLKGLESNVDPFTQQNIWNEFDPPQQQYQDILIWMSSYMVPPFMSPRNKSGAVTSSGGPAVKLLMATGLKDGNIGKDGLPKYDVPYSILAFFGFNTYSLNPEWQLGQNLKWMSKDIDKINQRLSQLMRDPSLSADKRMQLVQEYNQHVINKTIEMSDYVDSIKDIDKRLYGRGITKAREDIRGE